MNAKRRGATRSFVAILCAIALVPGDTLAYAAQQPSNPAPASSQAKKIPPEQLDSLVAHCPLPGPVTRAGSRRIHVPSSDSHAPAMAGEEQAVER